MDKELNKLIIAESPKKEINVVQYKIKEINKIDNDPLLCGQAEILWATYNTVNYRPDRMMPGCFTEEMISWSTNKYPLFVKDHNMATIIGRVDNAYDTKEGPVVDVKFINTVNGRDAYVELKSGAKTEFSYAWYPIEYKYVEEDGVVIREVYKARYIEEISHVPYGMDPKTRPIEVNSKDLTIRHAETALKNAGFSNKDAKTILSSGFKSLNRDDSAACDATEDIETIMALTNLNFMLKETTKNVR